MNGDKRNFSLSIWDHKDNFLCNLKSANLDFNGQSYNENFTENVNGEKVLTFSIPMYIFLEKNGKFAFEPNEAWIQIKNEQKIRYTEYHPITNKPERIEEFVLKEFTEERNGEEKIANCTCESLAVYELGKVGWGITFDTDYITDYELGFHDEQIDGTIVKTSNCPDLLTLDYWMRKLLYKETNLGRVSNTTECTYLLQGLQLRDDEGYPIDNEAITVSTNLDIQYKFNRLEEEPICSTTNSIDFEKYYNPTGWTWEVQAKFENDPEKQSVSTLYETPVINKFIETFPSYYVGYSYQKGINSNSTSPIQLRPHPIEEQDLDEWTYVTDIKKRLITVERSNLFSIIQDLSETFQVWADFKYHYSDGGKIDERKIIFKTEAINEDIKFDFSYGKNLQSCSRFKNSNDLITKLYIKNTESELVDGNILSIQQATANPTGENYIYNFDYFYDSGMLTKEESLTTNSDEYKINLHCGKLRDLNNKIINIQNFLTPLYDRKNTLESEIVVQEGSKNGYMDNIQSIQDKIDAISPDDQIIESWSKDNTQYNHVGELRTYSVTSTPDGFDQDNWLYINFGREDIIVKKIRYYKYYIDNDNIVEYDTTQEIPSFTTRVFTYGNWHSGDSTIEDDNTSYFTIIEENQDCVYDYSSIGDKNFIKGIYFRKSNDENSFRSQSYGRMRYTYAPLAYYYLLIKDYWEKILDTKRKIEQLNRDITEIDNKILLYELQLKNLLKNKNELILQFENKYKPFIREGYWEPSNYQSQLSEKIFDTSTDKDNFNLLDIDSIRLNKLNLNDSLSNYSYYFSLGPANEIDIDSIEAKVITTIGSETTYVPHYKGNNFELYLDNQSPANLICAISPEVIDSYNLKGITDSEFYKTKITYREIQNGEIQESTTSKIFEWVEENDQNPKYINNYRIYINDSNILTDRLKVYGNEISIDDSNLLTPYTDYSYNFMSVGYNPNTNRRVNLSEQSSYSTDIIYEYSFYIDFKLTNNTIKFLYSNPHFIVSYAEETTLQYIYNDSVATSKKYSVPQVEYNISVVDLSSLNGYENYKPRLGQKVPIFDPEMNFNNFQGFITSINYPLEEKYNTELTIATYNTKFEDIFQKLTATMTDINYNSNEIYKAANSFEKDGTIKTDVFKRSLQNNFDRVNLGVNNDIIIDKVEGIVLQDNDNNSGVKIIGNGIFLTDDITKGTDTEWRTGITGEGINTNVLTAGNLDTKQITIWNASERQARFVWNEQGLFAYGDKFGESESTSVSTYQELIDYNKYIKFNQNGFDFVGNNRSALSLNWQGLKISTQDEALQLDAQTGLTLQQWNENHTDSITRLELGKLDNGSLYGLRLKDISGTTTLQSDSDGDLWLHKYIQLGGSIDNDNTVHNATAGIYGFTSISTDQEKIEVPTYLQMGMRRNNSGTVIWDSTPIRFWAGIQTTTDYIDNIHISENEVKEAKINGGSISGSTNFYSLTTGDPSLAKFKVSANGDIIASGIDVGGWVGQGDKLRSSNNEAILRSGTYESNAPVFAIGAPSTNPDIEFGRNYNFRVYKDGSINIGNGTFTVDKDGNTNLNSLQISVDNVGGINDFVVNVANEVASEVANEVTNEIIGDFNLDTVGGYANTSTGLTSFNPNNYYVALMKPSTSTDYVFFAGTVSSTNIDKNAFWIKADGSLKATAGSIGGWTIDNVNGIKKKDGSYYTLIKPNSNNDNSVFYIGTDSNGTINKNTTSFAVTGKGAVYFKQGIYGYSNSKNIFRPGFSEGVINKIYTVAGKTIDIEICQGLIVDMRNV